MSANFIDTSLDVWQRKLKHNIWTFVPGIMSVADGLRLGGLNILHLKYANIILVSVWTIMFYNTSN